MLKFWKYTNKKEFIKLLTIRLIVIIIMLINPKVISNAIDYAINKNVEEATKYVIILVLINVLIHIFYVLEDFLFGINDMEAYISQFSKINQTLTLYDCKKVNIDEERIVQELGQNFEIVQPFVYRNILKISLNVTRFFVMCIIVYFISPWILLVFLIIVPISAFISYKSEENIAKVSTHHLNDMKKIKGYLVTQKKLSKEERFLNIKQHPHINKFFLAFKNNLIKKVKYESIVYNIFVYGTLNFAIMLTTIISIILIMKGQMTAGDYTAVSLYIGSMWDPILDIFNIRREYVSSKPALISYNDFLNMPGVVFNNENIKEIEIKDYVSLGNDKSKLHKPLTRKFINNKINLIIGDNGIGKTTLVEAILNLTNRYEGEILINNKTIDKFRNVLYKDFVYVPSNPVISEYGNLKEKVFGSSGQKKLSQLKHSVETKKSVYIFDEPTNFLDQPVKYYVLDLIKSLLSEDRIVIVISHDKIFLDNNDNINVIKIG